MKDKSFAEVHGLLNVNMINLNISQVNHIPEIAGEKPFKIRKDERELTVEFNAEYRITNVGMTKAKLQDVQDEIIKKLYDDLIRKVKMQGFQILGMPEIRKDKSIGSNDITVRMVAYGVPNLETLKKKQENLRLVEEELDKL